MTFESFSQRMIEICNLHRKQNRAMAFAFILYNFQNPQVRKILYDKEYWLALNEISGKYLTVFSLNYRPSRKSRAPRNQVDNYMRMLTMIPTKSGLSEGTDAIIEKYFGSNLSVTYPAILFFQVDGFAVIDSLLIKLRQEQIEPAFLELKDYLQRAVEALTKIDPENKNNLKEIFNCLEQEVRSSPNMSKIKRAAKAAGKIVELVNLLRGIGSN